MTELPLSSSADAIAVIQQYTLDRAPFAGLVSQDFQSKALLVSSGDHIVCVASSDHKFAPKSGFCKWRYTRGYMYPVRNNYPESAWETERVKRVKAKASGGAAKALAAPVDPVPPVSSVMVVRVPSNPTLDDDIAYISYFRQCCCFPCWSQWVCCSCVALLYGLYCGF